MNVANLVNKKLTINDRRNLMLSQLYGHIWKQKLPLLKLVMWIEFETSVVLIILYGEQFKCRQYKTMGNECPL